MSRDWQIPVKFREPVQTISPVGSVPEQEVRLLLASMHEYHFQSPPSLSPPGGWVWRIDMICIKLDTNHGTTGNRYAGITLTTIPPKQTYTSYLWVSKMNAQPVSCIGRYTWGRGLTPYRNIWNAGGPGGYYDITETAPLPELLIDDSMFINLYNYAGKAADYMSYAIYGEMYKRPQLDVFALS